MNEDIFSQLIKELQHELATLKLSHETRSDAFLACYVVCRDRPSAARLPRYNDRPVLQAHYSELTSELAGHIPITREGNKLRFGIKIELPKMVFKVKDFTEHKVGYSL